MNGKVLDIKGDEVSAGAPLIVYDRKSTPCPNQLWYEDENGILRSKLNGYVIDTRGERYHIYLFYLTDTLVTTVLFVTCCVKDL
jgi:hypothetical protein